MYSGDIEDQGESIALEMDIIMPLAGNHGNIYVFQSNRMWSQVKTAGSAIYANRQYLDLYRKNQPDRLANYSGKGDTSNPKIVGDVFIHPTANVHHSCVVSHNKCVNLKNIIFV